MPTLPENTMDGCLRGLMSRGCQPQTILDVGAADGGWTRHAMRFWPLAHYTLIEPLEERKAALDALQQEKDNVSFHLVAAGAADGETLINVSPDLYGSTLAYTGKTNRTIPVVALDRLTQEGAIPPVQLLKIDVQGFELEVLKGAEKLLQPVEVAIIETYFFRFNRYGSLVHELVIYMHQRGFRTYQIFDQLPRPFDGAIGQCDICFVRDGSPLLASNRWA